MDWLNVIIMGIGLAMDCCAVSAVQGLTTDIHDMHNRPRPALMAIIFGLFHTELMEIIDIGKVRKFIHIEIVISEEAISFGYPRDDLFMLFHIAVHDNRSLAIGRDILMETYGMNKPVLVTELCSENNVVFILNSKEEVIGYSFKLCCFLGVNPFK